MTSLPGCETPIRSAADLTLWWAAVLSVDASLPIMSMMWLDRLGRMQGRVLSLTGVPLTPDRVSIRALLDVHEAVVAKLSDAAGHLARTLSRPGNAHVSEADEEWTEALELELDDRLDGAWSLHLAAGGWITPVVEPWAWKWGSKGLLISVLCAAVDLNR
jgi:hypothetical protein